MLYNIYLRGIRQTSIQFMVYESIQAVHSKIPSKQEKRSILVYIDSYQPSNSSKTKEIVTINLFFRESIQLEPARFSVMARRHISVHRSMSHIVGPSSRRKKALGI